MQLRAWGDVALGIAEVLANVRFALAVFTVGGEGLLPQWPQQVQVREHFCSWLTNPWALRRLPAPLISVLSPPAVKYSLICLLCLLPPAMGGGGGDLANPLPGRALGGEERLRLQRPLHSREPKARRTPPPAASRSALQPGRRTTLRSRGRSEADASPTGSREQERNHGPRLPAPLGPGGLGRQLRRLGELGGRSGAAKAVLRSCPGHQLELPP